MKTSNANKVISILVSVAMCPMMLPTSAFAAENDAASSTSSSVEQAQPADQAEGTKAGASSSNDTLAAQPEAAGNTANATASEETSAPATTTEKAEAATSKAAAPAAETGEEGTEAAVAEVNGVSYPSLQAAIDAAQAGDAVQLLADAVVDDTVIVKDKGTITLDLNGKTISNTKEIWNEGTNKWSLISVRGNSDLTITGNGAVDALTNDSYAIDLYDATSKCTIENGTFNGNITAVYILEGALEINGGTFNIKQLSNQGDRRFTINCYDSSYKNGTAQVTITGGTFNGFDPANNLAEGTATNFMAPGYTSVANVDGTFSVAAGVAQVAGKTYPTLQAAIDAAQDGETVTLLTDIVLDAQAGAESTLYPQFTISNKKLTLDMRGHKISYSEESYAKNYGSASLLTLSIDKGSDVVITGNGTIDTELGSNQAYGINVLGGSNLTIDNGTFYGAMTAVQVQKGSLVINDGTFLMSPTCNEQVPQYAKYIINCIDAAWKDGSATVSIKGGTFGHDYSNSPEGEGTSYLAPGYTSVANVDGTFSVAAGVAQVAGKTFPTLQAAIDAAQDGETVTLLGDVEQNSQLAINKDITLDLNGKTIGNTVDIWGDNANAILSIKNGAKVAITGDGTITAKENDCYTINVVDGDLAIENGTFVGNISVVQVQKGSLTINGGAFSLLQKMTDGKGESRYLINCIDDAYADGSASVAISGGTFVGFDPNVSPEQKVDGKAPSFAAPGVGITKNEDGSFTAAAGKTAQILDKDGNSVKACDALQAAIDAAQDGETVTLLADATEDATIAAGKNIALDLGGKTLTNTTPARRR